jgi:acetylornithine deacetylase
MTPDAFAALAAHLNHDRLLGLLRDAVMAYSPSYAEAPSVDVFATAMLDAGLRVERQPVRDENGEGWDPERHNLIVRLGPQPLGLTWVGHTDTVVLIDDEQLDARVEDGVLWGVGSVDMKGACAAAVEALIALAHSGLPLQRGIALTLVVGEEEYGDGVAALPSEVIAPLVVVGEPTELRPALRHFTYEEIELHTHGARAHAALPEHGSNAIHAMLRWTLAALERTNEAEWPEPVAINPRTIRGGDTMFAIAERCTAEMDVHLPPGMPLDRLRAIVAHSAEQTAAEHPGVTCRWEPVFTAEGYALSREDAALAPLERAFALAGEVWEPGDFRSHSDAAALYARGHKPVVCGPGSLAVAHTVHEHIALEQLQRGARLYLAMFAEAAGV